MPVTLTVKRKKNELKIEKNFLPQRKCPIGNVFSFQMDYYKFEPFLVNDVPVESLHKFIMHFISRRIVLSTVFFFVCVSYEFNSH